MADKENGEEILTLASKTEEEESRGSTSATVVLRKERVFSGESAPEFRGDEGVEDYKLLADSDDPSATSTKLDIQRFRGKTGRLPSTQALGESRSHINGEMLRVVRGVEGIIRDSALTAGIPIRSVKIYTRRFIGDRGFELKFVVETPVNSAQAIAFWDFVDNRLRQWETRLRGLARRNLVDNIAISVEWEE